MKICKVIFLAIVLCGITANVVAIDLMDVYKDALANDPEFKAARSKWLANKENLAISKSALLPQLEAKGSITRNYAKNYTGGQYSNNKSYALTLIQPIFNFGSWATVWKSQAIAKGAKASFLAAEEDLLQRTAKAYFSVLQAKDILSYAKSKKAEASRLYTQAKRKYEVGLTNVVNLEDARKNYYASVSEELQASNSLSDQFERLGEITNVRYTELDPLKPSLPLLSPNPTNIEQWVKAAKEQNFGFIAARYDAIVARENVKVLNAGHLPTITAEGSYGYDKTYGGGDSFSGRNASAGLNVSMPLFQGGGVVAAARQAGHQYQEKLAIQEQTYRAVVSNTRQTYLGVLSNISKIKADIQAIKASRSSLRATEANYSVGTLTMADVLNAQTKLYEAQKTFAEDEYNYIIQLLTLKSLTGILGVDDLEKINAWLEKKPQGVKNSSAVKKETTKAQKQKTKAKPKVKVIKKDQRPKVKKIAPTFKEPKVTRHAAKSSKVSDANNKVNSIKKIEPTKAVTKTTTKAANKAAIKATTKAVNKEQLPAVIKGVKPVVEVPAQGEPVKLVVNMVDKARPNNSKIVVFDTADVQQVSSSKTTAINNS